MPLFVVGEIEGGFLGASGSFSLSTLTLKPQIEIGAFWPLRVALGTPRVAGPVIGPKFISLARPKPKTRV